MQRTPCETCWRRPFILRYEGALEENLRGGGGTGTDNRRKERRSRHARIDSRGVKSPHPQKNGIDGGKVKGRRIFRGIWRPFMLPISMIRTQGLPPQKTPSGNIHSDSVPARATAKPLRRMFRELGSDVEALARSKPERGILPGRWLMECSWPGSTIPAAFPKNVKHPSVLLAPFAGSPLFTPCSKCFRLLLWLLKVRPTRKPDAIKPARRRSWKETYTARGTPKANRQGSRCANGRIVVAAEDGAYLSLEIFCTREERCGDGTGHCERKHRPESTAKPGAGEPAFWDKDLLRRKQAPLSKVRMAEKARRRYMRKNFAGTAAQKRRAGF